MIRYPNGIAPSGKPAKKAVSSASSANRGMHFENDINLSNLYYNEQNLALITKRPTPINIVKVDYARGARITDAYFEKQSTTDYNGIYRGKYVDFEAKSTRSKTSFPLGNISSHQCHHLQRVKEAGGLAFFIICFSLLDTVYVIDAALVIAAYEHQGRHSIPLSVFKEKGVVVRQGYTPRLYYLEAVDALFF